MFVKVQFSNINSTIAEWQDNDMPSFEAKENIKWWLLATANTLLCNGFSNCSGVVKAVSASILLNDSSSIAYMFPQNSHKGCEKYILIISVPGHPGFGWSRVSMPPAAPILQWEWTQKHQGHVERPSIQWRSFQTGSKKTWVEKRLERKNCKEGHSRFVPASQPGNRKISGMI